MANEQWFREQLITMIAGLRIELENSGFYTQDKRYDLFLKIATLIDLANKFRIEISNKDIELKVNQTLNVTGYWS